jgi:ABC-type nitrate/sulfonate/bicarbonate transport system permease component
MIIGQNQPPRRRLRDMLRSFRPSRTQFFTELLLPAIVPVILTNWKT